MENNMSNIINFTTGYYNVLFHGSKMYPSISTIGTVIWNSKNATQNQTIHHQKESK
jgi:hypothetical protein